MIPFWEYENPYVRQCTVLVGDAWVTGVVMTSVHSTDASWRVSRNGQVVQRSGMLASQGQATDECLRFMLGLVMSEGMVR